MTAPSSSLAFFTRHAAKGFDFLGFHCCPTGVKVSDAALSRRDAKVARLYEQGASDKRIARYLARWLGWAAVAVASANCYSESQIAYLGASQGSTQCSVTNFNVFLTDRSSSTTIGHTSVPLFIPWGKCGVYVRGIDVIVTVTQTIGGAVSCSPSVPEYGLSTTCTVATSPGFVMNTWNGACAGSAATPTCTLSNITAPIAVSATFTAIPGYVPTGPVSAIVLDPTTPTTLFSALDGGGVYKKIGAGAWTASTTQPTNLNVKALAIKPDGVTLFAGTDGGGVFKSADSGDTWAACANTGTGMTNLNIRSLALTGSTLYAGTTAGVFTSTDDCSTWAAMSSGLP